MLNKYGVLYAFGRGLGLGSVENRDFWFPTSPVIDYSTVKFIDIAAGTDHNLVLSDKGKVFTFGNNGVRYLFINFLKAAQLGTGDFSNTYIATQINISLPVMKIAAGNLYSMVIASNFTCYGKLSNSGSICSGNGICTQMDVCSCGYGFTGIECQFTSCFGKNSSDPKVCSGNGNCTIQDICSCKNGFNGKECEIDKNNLKTTMAYSCGYNNVNFILFTPRMDN
jgi:hypothetical protein